MREIRLGEGELDLILSALMSDTLGTWGDTRHVEIKRLISRLKRERASK